MQAISGAVDSSPAETAIKNVLALNTAMFGLYDAAGRVFQKNILAQHPVILGLFSGAGGRFILYRPGMAPLEAPSVPIVYQLMKSVGHSVMALSEVVMPYLDNAENQSWRGPLLAYRSQMQTALDTLDATDMQADWRATSRTLLQNNIAFMDACIEKGSISMADLQSFARDQAPLLKGNIAWAAETQVEPLDERHRRSGRSCSAATGTRPTRQATRSMSRARITCCSVCLRSFLAPMPSTAA